MTVRQPQPVELNIPSHPAKVSGVRRAVEQYCVDNGFDERTAGEIGLCVNEALANVIVHAYAGATDQKIHVSALCRDREVTVSIRDWGPGDAPPPPPEPQERELLKPGGLGLICLRQLMDQVIYTPKPDGMLLTMKRRMRQAAQSG